MTIATLFVTAGGIGLVATLARYFFKPGVATVAGVGDDGQEVTVVVQGGYQPNLIHAHTGAPLRLVFDRREDGDCSSRVVFGDLGVNRFLAPFATTVVEPPHGPAGHLRVQLRDEHDPRHGRPRRRTSRQPCRSSCVRAPRKRICVHR